jgi:hypothetical protein
MVVAADGKVARARQDRLAERPVGGARRPEAGEQVMVDGFQKLRPGAPVKPVPWKPPAPPPAGAAAPAAAAGRESPASARRRLGSEVRAAQRMAKFFIDRPIFAWVIALFIIVLGGVAITQLPISQYPPVAPPAIVVSAAYPGASAQTLEDSVISVIEQEMNGSPGLIYMESVAQADGSGQITLSFEPGTNPDLAQVDVQNRLSRATPRLPAAVTQQGVRVDKSRSNFLLFTILSSDDPPSSRRSRWATTPRATCCPNPARARRRPGAAVRHRARDAHLDRPGQAGGLQPVGRRRQRRHPRAERAGVRRLHRRPAQRAGQGIAATVVVNGQLATSSSSATSCCAPTPTAPPCG